MNTASLLCRASDPPGQQPADQLPLLLAVAGPVPLHVLEVVVPQQVAAVLGIDFGYLKSKTPIGDVALKSFSSHLIDRKQHLPASQTLHSFTYTKENSFSQHRTEDLCLNISVNGSLSYATARLLDTTKLNHSQLL